MKPAEKFEGRQKEGRQQFCYTKEFIRQAVQTDRDGTRQFSPACLFPLVHSVFLMSENAILEEKVPP